MFLEIHDEISYTWLYLILQRRNFESLNMGYQNSNHMFKAPKRHSVHRMQPFHLRDTCTINVPKFYSKLNICFTRTVNNLKLTLDLNAHFEQFLTFDLKNTVFEVFLGSTCRVIDNKSQHKDWPYITFICLNKWTLLHKTLRHLLYCI